MSRDKAPAQKTTPRPVMRAQEMAKGQPLPGDDFWNPTIKPERPIVPSSFYKKVMLGKKKSPGVHYAPRIVYRYDWRDIDKQTGGVYTHKPLRIKQLHGRHPTSGIKQNKTVGLGYTSFDYFIVDVFRDGPAEGYYEERVLEVRRDPNRTAWIAQCAGERGRRWLIATHGIEAGHIIRSTRMLPPRPITAKDGDGHPVGALAPGTNIHSVETFPGDGALYANNAGTFYTVLRQTDTHTILEVPGKRVNKELAVQNTCLATVGRCSNLEWNKLIWQSAYMHIRFGYKTKSGLWHRKDGWCGRKAHPVPPLQTIDQPQLRYPELYRVTLTKKDTRAKFGSQNVHPMLYDRH